MFFVFSWDTFKLKPRSHAQFWAKVDDFNNVLVLSNYCPEEESSNNKPSILVCNFWRLNFKLMGLKQVNSNKAKVLDGTWNVSCENRGVSKGRVWGGGGELKSWRVWKNGPVRRSWGNFDRTFENIHFFFVSRSLRNFNYLKCCKLWHYVLNWRILLQPMLAFYYCSRGSIKPNWVFTKLMLNWTD